MNNQGYNALIKSIIKASRINAVTKIIQYYLHGKKL
jgi:hypothetical protein